VMSLISLFLDIGHLDPSFVSFKSCRASNVDSSPGASCQLHCRPLGFANMVVPKYRLLLPH
jgi:hypothetical protein